MNCTNVLRFCPCNGFVHMVQRIRPFFEKAYRDNLYITTPMTLVTTYSKTLLEERNGHDNEEKNR